MKTSCGLSPYLFVTLAGLVSCSDPQSGGPRDAATSADVAIDGPFSSADAGAEAATPLDCNTLEQRAPGFETQAVTAEFSAGAAPKGPSGTDRNIAAEVVYRRTHVAQYGGAADVEPPLPTLIKFSFDADSNQLRGEYCVVQATKAKDGGTAIGHYQISFVPRSPGSASDFVVNATMKPPSSGKFPIGFDGNPEELTVYVATGSTTYLETYVALK